jgi:hypothetical protein
MISDFEDSGIGHLVEQSKDTMMNMVYNAIVNNEHDAIYNNSPVEERLEALQNVIRYFEDTEEYEKCFNIKKIIDKIC